ncbi:hypothetical protein BGZ96_008590 [Linnemannia gamsii]|uniref:G-protein coupled receptors family 3 profile domain-containing protein n=1 Tax=Linnemannia gamsii TaxID=64522 RepID=A0ABQ7JY09_9FUNG|nr:hypothetical protein BGZ96_008590 [Linnemannia gamsii]
MKKSGYLGPEYGWVTMNDISETIRKEPDYDEYDGLIMIDNDFNLTGYPAYDKFMAEWMALDVNDYPGAAHEVVNSNEAMAYSCVMMIANAYGDLVRRTIGNNASISDPYLREIMAGDHTHDIHVSTFYSNEPYIGPSGRIMLDSNGDRLEGPYHALSLQNGESVPFALIFGSNYTSLMPPPFKSTRSRLPYDAPTWVIKNPRWSNTPGKILGVLCIFAILLTMATSSMVFIFRHHIVIKAASPVFCLFELAGLLLVYIWCVTQVGIPTFAICIARAFIFPLGVTLLTGSLTFKNYRIYRIFNSITVSNRIFHTGRLLKFLAVAVILTVIPSIVEVLVYPPIPNVINSNYDQWVRCSSSPGGVWRMLVSAVVPIFLVIFGVFLAFKTRNVMVLWNEAREISLVLYLLIVVFQFFDEDLYIATFYMTFTGTFFTATFALLCLFLPKLWRLLSSYEERDESDTTHSWRGGGPSRERQLRLGTTGYLVADGAIGGNGNGGSGGTGGLSGLGGGELGGAGGKYASARSSVFSAQSLGRMPDDLNFGSFPTATLTSINSQSPKPSPPFGIKGGSDDAAVATGVDLPDSVEGNLNSQPILRPMLTSATTTSHEQGTQAIPRRRSDALSVAPSSHLNKYDGNLIEHGTNTKLPRKTSEDCSPSTTTTNIIKVSASTIGGKGRTPLPQPEFVRRNLSEDMDLGSGDYGSIKSQQRLQEEGHGTMGQAPIPLSFQEGALDIHTSPVSQKLGSGIDRCMNSFEFLVPIRFKRNWITGVLSHWSMATLILIPEAHAFLAVDSADKKSRSYLMIQMAQDHSTPDEPTIRVNTYHNDTLLIRFETQSRLDTWMALFDEEDLNALRPRSESTSMLPSTALTSSLNQIAPQPPSSAWGTGLTSPNSSGRILGSGHVQDSDYGVGQSAAHGARHRAMSTGTTFPSASTSVAGRGGNGGKGGAGEARPFFGAEMTELLHLPIAAATGGGGLRKGDDLTRSCMNMAVTAYTSHPQQQQQQRSTWDNYQPGFGSNDFSHATGEPGNKPSCQNYDTSNMNVFNAAGAMPMADPRASHQRNNNSVSATDDIQCLMTIPTMPSSALSLSPSSFAAQQQSPRHSPQSSTRYGNLPLNFTTTTTSIDDDDDDDEDLYDPEFGIGGNGRRRCQNKNSSAVGRSGSGFSSSAASSTRSSVIVSSSSASRSLSRSVDSTRGNNNTNRTPTTVAMIPSAAVISTAAAAVAAGWKESDALVAATADPSGSFLAGYSITPPHPAENKRNSNSRCSPSTGATAGTRGSPVRKSFGDFRQSSSLSSGLSLLTSGQRSLGQIFSDRSGNSSNGKGNGNSKNPKSVAAKAAERSFDTVEPVGNVDDKVLSYSQYLAQTQAAAAAEAVHQSQQQQASSQMPVAPKAEALTAPPLITVSSTAPSPDPAACSATVMAVPPLAEDDEVTAPQVTDAPTSTTTTSPDQR